MSRVWRYAWIIFGLNIAAFFLCVVVAYLFPENLTLGLTFLFLIPGVLIVLQLIMGVIFMAGTKRETLGRGMLMAVGFIMLIGLSFYGIATVVEI
jgi:hypothetical protein